MEVENRRFSRNLFPESPSRSNDSLSSENTIGPISPLSTPEKPNWSIQTSMKKSAAMLRRSPRNAHKEKTLDSSISMLATTLVEETPEKDKPNSQNCLVTPHAALTKNSIQVLNTPTKPGRVFIEESPDIAFASPGMSSSPKVPQVPEVVCKDAYSPRTGFPCSMFYAKPKAKLSLFHDYILKRPTVATVKRKRGRDTHQGFAAKRKSMKRSKRDMYGEVNKNVWHGIKKPKPKKVVPVLANEPTLIPNEKPTLESRQHTPVKELKPRVSLVRLPSPIADPNKKFFKTNRTLEINRMATVTVDKNIRFEVTNGKISLQRKERKFVSRTAYKQMFKKLPTSPTTAHRTEPAFEPASELDDPVKVDEVSLRVNSILDHLARDEVVDLMDSKENMAAVVNANAATPPGAKLRAVCTADTIHREVAALDIVSPKSATKLFPIFDKEYANQQQLLNASPLRKSPRATVKRTWHEIGEDQYQIDAGQRRFGATQCADCGLVYQFGDPDDERAHQRHHASFTQLKFLGWKNERVVNEYDSGRVIGIYPGDTKAWRNKVAQVLEIIDRELGSVHLDELELASKKTYLYIADRRVVGCLVAEGVSEGYRMLSDVAEVDCCSTEGSVVFCGVLRLWTAPDWRRRKIATRLVDSMRGNFLFGCILGKNDFAFSVPTMMGKDFAKSYTATPEYLVYA